MLKLYCQKCGGLNAYVSEKPNFCQKCGSGLNVGAEQSRAVARADTVDENDEETIAGPVVFDLSGLDVDYFPTKSGTETIGSLAGTMGEGYKPEGPMPAPEGHQAYTMEDFKREAGQQRGGNEPEET